MTDTETPPTQITAIESSKRRMPDHLHRFLLRVQGGPKPKYYLPAAYRLVWFRDELGDEWGIKTKLVEGGHEVGFATVHAEIINPEGRVIASDLKTETKQDFPQGWVEKAATGAVARALALMGFGTQFMPELDDDGRRPADSPREMGPPVDKETCEIKEVWEGPGQCPRCFAPEGKRHGDKCLGK